MSNRPRELSSRDSRAIDTKQYNVLHAVEVIYKGSIFMRKTHEERGSGFSLHVVV